MEGLSFYQPCCSIRNIAFKSAESNQSSLPEEFVQEMYKKDKKNKTFKNGSTLNSPVAVLVGLLPLLGCEIWGINQIIKAKKTLSSDKLKDFKKKFNKNFKIKVLLSLICGVSAAIGTNYLMSQNSDKNYKIVKDKFEKINTQTSAELENEMISSSYIGAYFNAVSGNITLEKTEANDPILRSLVHRMLKHELVHARQHELVARSKDGIKKINFAVLLPMVREYRNIPNGVESIEEIYYEYAKNPDKYKDTTFPLNNANVNLGKFLTAIHILINNPLAVPEDVPIIIDEEHYQKIIDEKGPLTKEEEEKANKYYEAMLDYKVMSPWSAFNPFSKYRQNLLEREAYKENPTIMSRLANLFSKEKV